jgi:hypothetical protein
LRGCLFQFDSQGNGCHGSRSPVADHGAYRAPVAMRVDQWKRRWDCIEAAYERWEQRQLQHRFARWSRRRRIALFVLLPVVLICCGGLLAAPGAWFVRETAAAGEGAPSPEAAANDYLMRLSYNDAAGLLPLLADDQQDRLLDQWQAYRGAMQSTAPPPFKLDIGRLRSGSVVGGRIAVSTEVQAVWREQDENGRLGGYKSLPLTWVIEAREDDGWRVVEVNAPPWRGPDGYVPRCGTAAVTTSPADPSPTVSPSTDLLQHPREMLRCGPRDPFREMHSCPPSPVAAGETGNSDAPDGI